MPTVRIDLRELGADGVTPTTGVVDLWPHRFLVVDDGDDAYAVTPKRLRIPVDETVAEIPLPPTPIGEALWVWVQGPDLVDERFLVAIPDEDCNLWDLARLDEATLDPSADPEPAWWAAVGDLQGARDQAVEAATAAEAAAAQAAAHAPSDRVADLLTSTPFFIGHRGSGDYWPEHTMAAYQGAVSAGAKAIEVSVWELPDGTWVCNHDATTDRTVVGRTGPIQRLTGPSVANMRCRVAGMLGPAYETGVPMTTLSEVLQRFGGKVVIFLENKQGFSDRAMRMLDLVESLVPDAKKSIVYKTTALNPAKTALADGIAEARARGYRVWGYIDAGTSQPLVDMVAAGVDMIGIPIPDTSVVGLPLMPDQEIAYVVSKGKPVIGWEVHRRHQVAKYSALGVQGMMCSGIGYVNRSTAAVVEDTFDLLTRAPGELPRVYQADYCQDYAVAGGDGELVIDSQYANSVLMGAHCPVTDDPDGYTIEFELKWAVMPSDTQHAGIAFGKPDDALYWPASANNPTPGNHMVVRPTGVANLYTHAPGSGAGTVGGGNLTTSAITAGQWTRWRITVTPVSFSLQRLDGTPSAVITNTSTANRGRYFHLTRNHDTTTGQNAHFRNVRVAAI